MELREKLSNKKFYNNKSEKFSLRISPEATFYWKLFKIGLRRGKVYKFEGPPLPRPDRLYLG